MSELSEVTRAIFREHKVPLEFATPLREEAQRALVTPHGDDLTSLPFIGIGEPPLVEHAYYLERHGDDLRVWCAAVDVTASVQDGALAAEAAWRYTALELPGLRTALVPSELADRLRFAAGVPQQALVFSATVTQDDVFRERRFFVATLVCREVLDFDNVQARLDGVAERSTEFATLLEEAGKRLWARSGELQRAPDPRPAVIVRDGHLGLGEPLRFMSEAFCDALWLAAEVYAAEHAVQEHLPVAYELIDPEARINSLRADAAALGLSVSATSLSDFFAQLDPRDGKTLALRYRAWRTRPEASSHSLRRRLPWSQPLQHYAHWHAHRALLGRRAAPPARLGSPLDSSALRRHANMAFLESHQGEQRRAFLVEVGEQGTSLRLDGWPVEATLSLGELNHQTAQPWQLKGLGLSSTSRQLRLGDAVIVRVDAAAAPSGVVILP